MEELKMQMIEVLNNILNERMAKNGTLEAYCDNFSRDDTYKITHVIKEVSDWKAVTKNYKTEEIKTMQFSELSIEVIGNMIKFYTNDNEEYYRGFRITHMGNIYHIDFAKYDLHEEQYFSVPANTDTALGDIYGLIDTGVMYSLVKDDYLTDSEKTNFVSMGVKLASKYGLCVTFIPIK